MSIYGNEWKCRFENRLSPDRQELIERILKDLYLSVQNISCWQVETPWNVPRRKINDNLLWIVESGEFLADVNGKCYKLLPGEGVMIQEHIPHAFHIAGDESGGRQFVLHFLLEDFLGGNLLQSMTSPFFRLRFPTAMFELLRSCIALCNTDKKCAFQLGAQAVQLMMLDWVCEGLLTRSAIIPLDPRIITARKLMFDNFAHDLSIIDIAAGVNLHEAQFRILFKRDTGMTPLAYLKRLRLLHASRLLARYSWPLERISAESGFSSSTYFCLEFHRFFGMTPNTYRKNYQY